MSLLHRYQLIHAFSAFFVSGQTVAGVAVAFVVVVMPGDAVFADAALAKATVG